jgi:mannose-6-phosphate isomerase-like protein (cupin superfamily)
MPEHSPQSTPAQVREAAAPTKLTAAGRSRTIYNPMIGDHATFLKSTEETNGESLLIRVELPAHGGAKTARHLHLQSAETFVVIEGELTVENGSDVVVLKVGDSATAAPRAHHRYLSASDLPCVFEVEIRPAGRTEDGLRLIYGLARDGRSGPNSVPRNPLELALGAQYSDMYLASLPVWVQKAIFGGLASIARMVGTEKRFARYLEPEPDFKPASRTAL